MWGRGKRYFDLLHQANCSEDVLPPSILPFPNTKYGLNGQVLRLATLPYAYRVVFKTEENITIGGYIGDVMDFCAQKLNFR